MFPIWSAQLKADSGLYIYLIIYILGNIFYVLLLGFYDHLMYRNLKNIPLIKNKILNYLFSGFIYFISIQLGIISSNCLYFLTMNSNYRYLWFILTAFITIITSTFWNSLQVKISNSENHSYWDSVWRSLFECICFNSLAWNTYFTLNLFITINISNMYVMIAIIPFVIGVVCIYNTIFLEFLGISKGLMYGLWHLSSFTSLAFSTNSIVSLLTPFLDKTLYLIIMSLICSIFTILCNANFYRLGGVAGFLFTVYQTIHYFFLFLNFVLVGWATFIPLSYLLIT